MQTQSTNTRNTGDETLGTRNEQTQTQNPSTETGDKTQGHEKTKYGHEHEGRGQREQQRVHANANANRFNAATGYQGSTPAGLTPPPLARAHLLPAQCIIQNLWLARRGTQTGCVAPSLFHQCPAPTTRCLVDDIHACSPSPVPSVNPVSQRVLALVSVLACVDL
ncbi:hypothetical protein AB1N83_001039 [Pleurotus pulmonarius]